MVQLVWNDLTEADLPDIAELARRCLAADGGLPTLDRPSTIRRLFGTGPGLVGRDPTGEVVAAGALVAGKGGQQQVTGLVDPALRGMGLAEELLAWARTRLDHETLSLSVENDHSAAREFAHRAGLVRVFGETVMRHDLHDIPFVPVVDGLVALPWGPDSRRAFHHVWEQSFAERPGFLDLDADRWVAWVESDGEFLPTASRVLFDGGTAVAFVTVSTDWVEQVGVVPGWRGRGVGAHLVARSLTALRKSGRTEAWLAVTEENVAAHDLYRALGFVDAGTRARYADAAAVARD